MTFWLSAVYIIHYVGRKIGSDRLDKMEKLRALKVNPYRKYTRTHFSTDGNTLAEKGTRTVEEIADENKKCKKLRKNNCLRAFGK